MKLNLVLTVLLITHALAENEDAKDVSEVEVKSAKKEDDVKSDDETSRNAEPYAVPVEVVKEAVTESELAKSAEQDGHTEDSRVERSTPSDVGLKSVENENYFSETEHIAIRRSNEEPSKAVDGGEKLVKSAEPPSDDVKEKTAKPEAEAEKDDVTRKAKEEEKKDDVQVRSADIADANEKSASPDESTHVSEAVGLEKVAEIEDVTSLMAEGIEDLKTNLNTRRMSNPIETFLDATARHGDVVGVSDEGTVKTGDVASKPGDILRPFDSFRRIATQPTIPPLMPLLSKHNFFLTPTLPLLAPPFTTTPSPLRTVPNLFPNLPPLQTNFLQSEQKPNFNSFSLQHPRLFPNLPMTTIRPLVPPLPLLNNYPNFEELFIKPADNLKPQANFQTYPNMGFNRRVQVAYGVPSYLRYNV